MGLLSSDMKAELQKTAPQVYVLLEVDYPTGTIRYAKPGVMSSSLGPYHSKVVSFGRLSRQVN